MYILGIETSCDETSAAVLEVKGGRFSVLSNIVSSQIKIHAKYGGVVPEVAARSHITAILPVIKKAYNLQLKKPDLIAVTSGPGLLTSLSVGVETARYLGYAWGVPVVATNHLAGHLYANFLSSQVKKSSIINHQSSIRFPALGLIVSGGHTELIYMKKLGDYRLVGATLDDAAGEAFDKIAKLLGLPYPGGPYLAKLAEKGNPKAYDFPRGMIKSGDLNFSFSGLKTALLYFSKKQRNKKTKKHIADICASVQAAIVDVLVAKTVSAAKKYRVKTVLVGGGVSANQQLRRQLCATLKKELPKTYHLSPITSYCTDNAAMIAVAGYIAHRQKRKHPLIADPNWGLG